MPTLGERGAVSPRHPDSTRPPAAPSWPEAPVNGALQAGQPPSQDAPVKGPLGIGHWEDGPSQRSGPVLPGWTRPCVTEPVPSQGLAPTPPPSRAGGGSFRAESGAFCLLPASVRTCPAPSDPDT